MVAFVFTLLVIVSIVLGIGAVVALPILFIRKKYRILTLIFGLAALVAAFPVGFWLDVGSDGCCGSRSGGNHIGWLIGLLLAGAGIFLLRKSHTLRQ